jgi:hypothetical protein
MLPKRKLLQWLLLRSLLLAAALFSIGCSGDDGKYAVSGAVTFKGESVPAGEIRFTPDTSKGHKGPVVLARIKEGRYETPRDKGVVGGPYQLRVSGYGAAGNSKDPTAPDFGRPLFPIHLRSVELPKEDHEYHIEIK